MIIPQLDLSFNNLSEDGYALLFNYGRNLNLHKFYQRLKPDMPELTTQEDLTSFLLGVYEAPKFNLFFEKRGSNGQVFANVRSVLTKSAYGTVFAVPKRILFSTQSSLNRSEGCSDIHNPEASHYWLRQLPLIRPYKGQSFIRSFPKINGNEEINCCWMYQACNPAITVGKPSTEYVNDILQGLTYENEVYVPQTYFDYIKSFSQ